MAIIRNPINQTRKGRVGDVTYYVSIGRQVVRQRLNNSNYGKDARRTTAQQTTRVKWANLVNFYKVSAKWMPKAYETRKKNQTDYNRFMQLNVPLTTIALPKEYAQAGACIAEGYLISQGSLPSVGISQVGNQYQTTIALGPLQITATTTVAEFSAAVVENNENISYETQISMVSYMQDIDNYGIPRLICTLYEVTLSSENTTPLRKYIPEFASTVVNGYLGTSNTIATGAFAYILSSLKNGSVKVSTQNLITNNAALIAEYSSAQTRSIAIDSYGVDQEVILNPMTTVEQGAVARPLYISYIMVNGERYISGQTMPTFEADDFDNIEVIMSEKVTASEVTNARATLSNGKKFTYNVENNEAGNLLLTTGSTVDRGVPIRLEIFMKSGTVLFIDFREQQTGGGELGE